MTVDQTIAIASSIGAFLSAFATFWTVREMAKQRSATYRPDLAFPVISFQAAPNLVSSGPVPDWWTERTTRQVSPTSGETDVVPLQGLSIPMLNVGLGAARDLLIEWSFPVERMIHELNGHLLTLGDSVRFTHDGFAVSSSSADGKMLTSSIWRNQRREEVKFVLPAETESSPVRLRLPHAYVYLYSALFQSKAKLKKGKIFDASIDQLTAKISYKDIANTQHHRQFTLTVSVEMAIGDGSGFFGRIECTTVEK
jgi:hypothetical protein